MTQYTITFADKKDNRKRAFTEIYNHSNGTSYY